MKFPGGGGGGGLFAGGVPALRKSGQGGRTSSSGSDKSGPGERV